MRLFLLFLLLTISDFLIAQQHATFKMDKVIIDSSLDNDLFYAPKNSAIHYSTLLTITNNSTGKIDSVHNIPKDIDIVVNANLHSNGNHFDFDNCSSFFNKDTLAIQFQNNSSFEEMQIFIDKIYLYIVNGYFFCKYQSVN